jgi:hypothetical protein
MENLSPHSIPALILLLCFALAVGLVVLWKSWSLVVKRRAARAMKRGNEIYRDWRQDTVRQPLQ